MRLAVLIAVTVLVTACSRANSVPEFNVSELYPGGDASVSIKPFASFMLPSANLAKAALPDFYAGKALARQPWVKAPTITTARDGLGPIYNARTCLACHANGGRGQVPDNERDEINHSFVRLSIPGADKKLGVMPEPTYGDQLQTQSIALSHQLRHLNTPEVFDPNQVNPEAYVYLDWQYRDVTYPDGEVVRLRFPKLNIQQLNYGELHTNALLSLRNAPPIHGSGLIELIDQDAINELADPHDRDGNGISGRVNQVWDADTNNTVPGRFGLKANRPANIKTVTAAAFAGDLGITNPLFAKQPCTNNQIECIKAPNGNDEDGVELPSHLLNLTADFIRQLAVPKRNQPDLSNHKGRELFYQSDCQQCHHPSFVTTKSESSPNLSAQKIWPYSDFLLHDMGFDLADGRPDFNASGSEWRTAPLWGVGLNHAVNGNQLLLHDGRARNVEEAILWHGGEAQASKDYFMHLTKADRHLLIRFVESL